MKKIAFVISAGGWGGLEMNVLNLARWLRDRQWEIIFYASPEIKITLKAIELGFSVVELKHWKYLDLLRAKDFARQLKETSVDQVLLFENKDIDFLFLTKSFFYKELKIIYQQHMQIGVDKNDWLHTLRYSVIDCWISPLKVLKQEVLEKTKYNPFKIKVIPLGLEISKLYPPIIDRHHAQEILGLKTDKKILGILGRIDPKKGQLFLVKSLHALLQKNLPVELLIMGESTINSQEAQQYLNEIQEYIDKNKLHQYISIKPFSTDVQTFYQAIDIFVLASEAETYGMVTIEAMLSGRPVIATSGGGTTEILGEGKFGLLYNYNDEDDFCNKVQWVLSHTDKVKHMTQNAMHHAVRKYSHDQECEQIEAILQDEYL